MIHKKNIRVYNFIKLLFFVILIELLGFSGLLNNLFLEELFYMDFSFSRVFAVVIIFYLWKFLFKFQNMPDYFNEQTK